MKLIYTGLFCICLTYGVAQQNVGIGTNTPSVSALLHLNSTSKGLLTPRLTTLQRTAIASPANGLLVYDTNTSSFWFYKNTAWTEIGTGSGGSNSWTVNNNDIYNNNTGSIGIGTASPVASAKITIETADNSTASVVRNVSGTAVFQTFIGSSANGNTISLGTPGSMPIALYTNNANRLFISSGGNVGIGTDNPGNKLEINGSIGSSAASMSVGGPLGFAGGILSLRNTNGNGQTLILDGSSMQSTFYDGINTLYTPVTINPHGGNVGIGITSPAAGVKTTIQTADYSTALKLRNTSGTASLDFYVGGINNANAVSVGTAAASPLVFYTNAANRLFISSNGDIGIGSDVPNSKLQVNGSLSMPIRVINTPGTYTITDDDYTLIADCQGLPANNIAFILPAAVGKRGRLYNISIINNTDIDFSDNYVYVYDNGPVIVTQLFERYLFGFSPTTTIAESIKRVTVQSDGTKWHIISSDYDYYKDTE